MKLEKPEEPAEIKDFITNLINGGVSPTYAIWLGNRLPKYLWSSWSKNLRSIGLRWQDFLKCVSKFEGDIIKWVNGEILWEDLLNEIMEGCHPAHREAEGVGLFKWLRNEIV